MIEVRQIPYALTIPFIMEMHYAHRMPSVSWAFGLISDDKLVGVVTYGKPASPSLCSGIAGEEMSDKVYELNRLVISPDCDIKNAASMLIGRSLKKLPKGLVIVSYADWGGQNHVGFVYQATNWAYTGATKERTDMAGEDGKHSRHNFGDPTHRQVRHAKHRYVTVTGDKRNMKLIKYDFLPYPKADTKRYEINYVKKQMELGI